MRPFFITLACSWAALLTAALVLSQQHPHSHWIMAAVLPAFLVEAIFYLGAVFAETRAAFARIRPEIAQAALLWMSALAPYAIFSLTAGTFQPRAFYLLILLTGVLSFWFVVLPRRLAYDIGFLVIAAAPFIMRVFQRIYQSPDAHIRGIDILGHLMWIRLGIAALLIFRGWNPGPFGFWPNLREWRVGIAWFAAIILPLAAISVAIGGVRFEPIHTVWWRAALTGIGTFFGILWVVALAEELFFRGVIERALLNVQKSRLAAVVIASILFGCAHLWFRYFPDWRRALVAGVLGLACGYAYAQTGSVRASMVTHACVVVTWRMLFRG
ncbi:MAG: CPBP family glutamic-type intramembrane protease [Bryobacteraceae bacterium]